MRMANISTPLRLSLAVVWLGSGVVSLLPDHLGNFAGLGLLAAMDINGRIAWSLLFLGCVADICLGYRCLVSPLPVWHCWLQVILILIYMLIISVYLPEYWLHPFAPIIKNIPMLAILLQGIVADPIKRKPIV